MLRVDTLLSREDAYVYPTRHWHRYIGVDDPNRFQTEKRNRMIPAPLDNTRYKEEQSNLTGEYKHVADNVGTILIVS